MPTGLKYWVLKTGDTSSCFTRCLIRTSRIIFPQIRLDCPPLLPCSTVLIWVTQGADQITLYLSHLTQHTAVVATVRSLGGSGRHGRATLHLFQKKHLLLWEYDSFVCLSGVASVKAKVYVLLEYALVKNWITSKKMQTSEGYETVFFKRIEKFCSCVLCFTLAQLTSSPIARRYQVIWRRQ